MSNPSSRAGAGALNSLSPPDPFDQYFPEFQTASIALHNGQWTWLGISHLLKLLPICNPLPKCHQEQAQFLRTRTSPYQLHCACHLLTSIRIPSESPQPRRLSASPNPDGSLALYTPHKHSRHSRVLNAEVRILDLKSGHSHTFSNDSRDREPSWLGEGNQVIWLRDIDHGATELWISDAAGSDKKYVAPICWGLPGSCVGIRSRKHCHAKSW